MHERVARPVSSQNGRIALLTLTLMFGSALLCAGDDTPEAAAQLREIAATLLGVDADNLARDARASAQERWNGRDTAELVTYRSMDAPGAPASNDGALNRDEQPKPATQKGTAMLQWPSAVAAEGGGIGTGNYDLADVVGEMGTYDEELTRYTVTGYVCPSAKTVRDDLEDSAIAYLRAHSTPTLMLFGDGILGASRGHGRG